MFFCISVFFVFFKFWAWLLQPAAAVLTGFTSSQDETRVQINFCILKGFISNFLIFFFLILGVVAAAAAAMPAFTSSQDERSECN